VPFECSHASAFFLLLQFPFFCSDREYIIARRIWKLGGAYYCVTKVKTNIEKIFWVLSVGVIGGLALDH
jgi:hypothetical protein